MPAETPRISIVMPLYNKEKEVYRAIRSVLHQTVKDFVLIVVNDGSTDKGPDIVRSINNPCIRLIKQENVGVSGARNRGIIEARSELIAFLDADDEWKPNFLETICRLQRNFPSCSVFATNYLYRDADGSFTYPIVRGLPGTPWEGIFKNYFMVASKSDPPISSSAVAVTRKAIISVGGFPVGATFGEDLLTWAKLALDYGIAYSTRPCAICWPPMNVHDRVGRFTNLTDIIGQEFGKLIEDADTSEVEGLKEYSALWHRMRGSILLRLGDRKRALSDIKTAISLSKKMRIKLEVYKMVASIPAPLSKRLYELLNFVWRLRRRCIAKTPLGRFIRYERCKK